MSRALKVCAAVVLAFAWVSPADAAKTPLSGDYSLNVPQIPGVDVPPTWTFAEASGLFTATTTFQVAVQPSVQVDVSGTMVGNALFGTIYIGTASFDSASPVYDSLGAVVFLIRSGDTLTGMAVNTANGVPASSPYSVTATAVARKGR